MTINVTLIGQMIAFAIFVWFTMKYVWPPISTAMAERQQKIADGLAAAEKGARALQDASSQADVELRKAREEAREIMASANRQASGLIEEAREQATKEAQRVRAAAEGEVAQQVAQARTALRAEVAALAVAGAEKILRREVDAKSHADLLDELAAKV
ncbi:MAG: F0F1 ATP synthase subunit B [Oceanococcaceae bacterium]